MTKTGLRVVLLACVAVAAGCGKPAAPAGGAPAAASTAPDRPNGSSESSLAIDYRSEPDPPRSGENRIEVTVRQLDGSPVTDASVTAVFSMPAMPSMNMPAMRSTTPLTHQSGGRYTGTESLSMAGTWNVSVTVSRGDQELGQKRFSVIAK